MAHECMNTVTCKPCDPEQFCPRCGHRMTEFSDADLKGNIARAEEHLKQIPVGEKFDISALFGKEN